MRPIMDRAFNTPATALAGHISADAVTGLSFVATLFAAGFASQGAFGIALAVWVAGRICDGLDGAIARVQGAASDFGGYLDLVGDTIGYAAIPLAIAVHVDARSTWIAVAFLLASFYVNSISWAYLSAVLERRGAGAQKRGETTSITMPPALIEGTETMMFFAVFLLIPSLVTALFVVMACLVAVNVAQRLLAARQVLR